MAMYAIELTPLLNMMLGAVIGAIMVTFTDDYTSVGSVRYHNLPQPRKSWLIVKQQHLGQAREIFKDTKISKISTRGKRQLRAVIGERFKIGGWHMNVNHFKKGWPKWLRRKDLLTFQQPRASYKRKFHFISTITINPAVYRRFKIFQKRIWFYEYWAIKQTSLPMLRWNN